MKKLLVLLFVLTLTLSLGLFACGEDKEPTPAPSEQPSEQPSQQDGGIETVAPYRIFNEDGTEPNI